VCITNQFNGPISGTVEIESGALAITSHLISKAFYGNTADTPCPFCVGDGAANDGIAGGTCNGGTRNGSVCDANGSVPGRADFGSPSLDCPPNDGGGNALGTVLTTVQSGTTTVARTLSAANSFCTGDPTKRCLCSTCNNAAAGPCMTNIDCPISGGNPGICGGKRCLAGMNAGEPCSTNSVCPASHCGRPGEPTKPNACLDDTLTPELGCVDTSPTGDSEGSCPDGPISVFCSNHPQRSCSSDNDCDGVAGACRSVARPCYLDNGALGGSIAASAASSTPVSDASTPTLASIFCYPPFSASGALNSATGLPGPARLTTKTSIRFLP
jgi:hypothetical protein